MKQVLLIAACSFLPPSVAALLKHASVSNRCTLEKVPSELLSTSRTRRGQLKAAASNEQVSYQRARDIRTEHGHDAAIHCYKKLLEDHPQDVTAATRIAVAPLERHDAACCFENEQDVRALQSILISSRYTNMDVQRLLRTDENPSSCPIFVRAAPAGTITEQSSPLSSDAKSPLECLVALFLLGIAVPKVILCKVLTQSDIEILQRLGLMFPCVHNPEYFVPYVHIFPLQIPHKNLWFVTDLHPRVLSTTTVGRSQHGTVMYIGPDSLALVQHVLVNAKEWTTGGGSCPIKILDLCTGSGIQAIAALHCSEPFLSEAVCMDINPRALRFTRFNAVLNGIDTGRLECVDCDLQNWQAPPTFPQFDWILANPPFLPVPSKEYDNVVDGRRYGLFSSGGTSGEDVLKRVIQLAPHLLSPSRGKLAVVSEFMNPPRSRVQSLEKDDGHNSAQDYSDNCLNRIQNWWGPRQARGILFTNEITLPANIYAERRADSPKEVQIWCDHLSTTGITHVSPGLLVVAVDLGETPQDLQWLLHERVPKTDLGSIWTPQNRKALAFTYERQPSGCQRHTPM